MKPTASPNHWPYTSHRNMAQVMADEKLDAFHRLPSVLRKGRSAKDFA